MTTQKIKSILKSGSPCDVCAICTFYGWGKTSGWILYRLLFFEFTLVNHCACQSAKPKTIGKRQTTDVKIKVFIENDFFSDIISPDKNK